MADNNPSQVPGTPIPENTPHAVSVTLPTWRATVAYEEGESWVADKMTSGYPRFFIHGTIQKLAAKLEAKYARAGEKCMIFVSYKVAKLCRDFIRAKSDNPKSVRRLLQLAVSSPTTEFEKSSVIDCTIACVFMQASDFPLAKQFWQHSGEGISSRAAEYALKELFENDRNSLRHRNRTRQELQAQSIRKKSPSISASIRSNSASQNEATDHEFNTFIEEKFGRVLDLQFSEQAKIALKRRISGTAEQAIGAVIEDESVKRGVKISENDVYLFPTGMSSIFNSHQAILAITDKPKKSVCFGFPYVDTLNILRKFGEGCIFYGHGDEASLDELEEGLGSGEIEINGLFCECPSNPLLTTPNLKRIRALADKFSFPVVVDETVGNFLNVSVFQYADIVVSSLTKIFSGDSNVMGGSLILNSSTPSYKKLKEYFSLNYEDNYWAEDVLHMERNSRDFEERSHKVNVTSLEVVNLLQNSPLISKVFYPSLSSSKKFYDEIKTANGGYGGLISFLFHNPKHAQICFDKFNLHKGPSLGTNFTLACPYAILAHYQELKEIAKWGVDENLIRISIGLEDKDVLLAKIKEGLDACEKV